MAKECKLTNEVSRAPGFEIRVNPVLGTVVHFEFKSIHGEVTIKAVCGLESVRDFARKLLDTIDRGDY